MKQPGEILERLTSALTAREQLEAERKDFLVGWKTRMAIVEEDIRQFREDALQMRLDEQSDGE